MTHNLLTRNQASGSDALGALDASMMFSESGCTIASSTAGALVGSRSILVTNKIAGAYGCAVYFNTPELVIGREYTVVGSFKSMSGSRPMVIDIAAAVGSQSPSVPGDGQWHQTSVTFRADAATALLYFGHGPNTGAVGDSFLVDKMGLWEGRLGTWEMPPFAYDHSIDPPPNVIVGFFKPQEKWTTGTRIELTRPPSAPRQFATRLTFKADNTEGGLSILTPGIAEGTQLWFTGEYRTPQTYPLDMGGFLNTATDPPIGNIWTSQTGPNEWTPFICSAKVQAGTPNNVGLWVVWRMFPTSVEGWTLDLRNVVAHEVNPMRAMVPGSPRAIIRQGGAAVGRAYLGNDILFGSTRVPV